jgi:hypothetical protein
MSLKQPMSTARRLPKIMIRKKCPKTGRLTNKSKQLKEERTLKKFKNAELRNLIAKEEQFDDEIELQLSR